MDAVCGRFVAREKQDKGISNDLVFRQSSVPLHLLWGRARNVARSPYHGAHEIHALLLPVLGVQDLQFLLFVDLVHVLPPFKE
jgi:hypothetical protein